MFVTQKITIPSIMSMMKMEFVTHQRNVAVVEDFIKQTVRLVMELVVFVRCLIYLSFLFSNRSRVMYRKVSLNWPKLSNDFAIVRASGNGESNEKVAYFSNPSFPFKDNLTNYLTYTVKVRFHYVFFYSIRWLQNPHMWQ